MSDRSVRLVATTDSSNKVVAFMLRWEMGNGDLVVVPRCPEGPGSKGDKTESLNVHQVHHGVVVVEGRTG